MFMPVLGVSVYWLSYNIIQTKFHSERLALIQSIFNESDNNNVCICNCKKGCRSNVCSYKKKSFSLSF